MSRAIKVLESVKATDKTEVVVQPKPVTEYKRIADIREYTFDSLEQLCNNEAKDGWRIVTISDGAVGRTATLMRTKDGN